MFFHFYTHLKGVAEIPAMSNKNNCLKQKSLYNGGVSLQKDSLFQKKAFHASQEYQAKSAKTTKKTIS